MKKEIQELEEQPKNIKTKNRKIIVSSKSKKEEKQSAKPNRDIIGQNKPVEQNTCNKTKANK
jgi:hypothetical protein